jgi:hypothetical protein
MNEQEIEVVARAFAAYKDTLPPDSADAAFIYSHRHGLAHAAIQALDEARGDGWRTIESAPRDGKFLAWHSGFNEARTVERFNMLDKPDTVINGASGKFFRAKWWRPLPAAPGEGK